MFQSARLGLGRRPVRSWFSWAKASRPSGLIIGSMRRTAFSRIRIVSSSLRVVRRSSNFKSPSLPESSKPWMEPPYQSRIG